MFFNGRLASATQYARPDPASETPHSAVPLLRDAQRHQR
jgi:hypothetical protein